MPEPIVCSFETFEEAGAARAALLNMGFAAEAVQLRVSSDEAGPVEGNFLIGNGRTTHGRPPGGVLAGPEVPYEENFSRTVGRGEHLLIVAVEDDTRRDLALAALQPFAAVHVERAGAPAR